MKDFMKWVIFKIKYPKKCRIGIGELGAKWCWTHDKNADFHKP